MGKSHPDSGPLYMQAMLSAQSMAGQQQQQAVANQIAREQLDLSRQAYQDQLAAAKPVNEMLIKSMQQQYDAAAADRARYEGTYVPLENQYIASAKGWDTPEAEQQAAAAAEANVAQQMEQGRSAAVRQLQAYGIDPGSPRYASFDVGARTAGAAAEAGAGNTAINQRQMEGLQLLQNAAGMGRGLPGQSLAGFAGAGSSGTGAINTGNSIINTGFGAMGTPGSYYGLGANYAGLANQNLGQIGDAFGRIYQGQTAQQNQSSGIGSLMGLLGSSMLMGPAGSGGAALSGALGSGFTSALALLSEGGEVPPQASPSGGQAIDDVPARLTPGEFVVPKDVVAWKGEEHFQKLIEQSRTKKQEATAQPEVRQALPMPQVPMAGRPVPMSTVPVAMPVRPMPVQALPVR